MTAIPLKPNPVLLEALQVRRSVPAKRLSAPGPTQDELLRIWEETRKTVVYITHSLDEAVLLGDRVVLMSAQPGRHLATFDIDLPRPRSIDTMNVPRFAEYRALIWDQLSAEVTRAMEMQQ